MTVVGVVAAAAGGLESLREGLVQPLLDDGHRVCVTVTPTAARWLEHVGEIRRLQHLTDLPVRHTARLPDQANPHPKPEVIVGAPLTANSVAKLALGIADNQAMAVLCESVATLPMVVFPRVNAAHARQPAWLDHLTRLRSVGVELIYGEDVWPLSEPRVAGSRELPWHAVLGALGSLKQKP